MLSHERYLQEYLAVAPIPLGLVRAIECRHMISVRFKGKVLDAGCGDGTFARILGGDAGAWVDVGVDRDPVELARARRSGAYRKLLACDMTCLPFGNGSFDTVMSNSVLEHIPDVDRALAELSRVLRPGGTLVFCVPSEYLAEHFFFSAFFRRLGLKGLAEGYGRLKNRIWRHHHIHPPAWWHERLAACGLAVEASRYIHPRCVTAACDLFTFSGALSLVWRALFGRLLLFPSAWRGRVMAALFRRYYQSEASEGSTLFVVAIKKSRVRGA